MLISHPSKDYGMVARRSRLGNGKLKDLVSNPCFEELFVFSMFDLTINVDSTGSVIVDRFL